jgi:hypothetical protein
MVELGIVKTVQEVDCAGPGGGKTNAEPASELGMGRGHEGRLFLVSHLHEIEAIESPVERAKDAVDAVAGITVEAGHSPFRKA